MRKALFIGILFLLELIGNSQSIYEYKEAVNHKLTSVTADIQIKIYDDKITILYAMPNTNFVEVISIDEYKIEKYIGEKEKDDKGYTSKVYLLENNFMFAVNYKNSLDHWAMLFHKELDGSTVYQRVK